MNQDKAQLCQSTRGRILLALRLDWGLYGRPLLIGAGVFALCCFCFPRLEMFFGASIEDFTYDYLNYYGSRYYYNFMFLGYILGFFGWLLYCNRRVQHTLSSAFALMPLRLSEHIASALVFALWIGLSVWAAVQAAQLLSWLTLPVNPDLYWHALPTPRLFGGFLFAINSGSWSLIIEAVINWLVLLLVMLVGVWASLRFRSIIKGWCVWFASVVIGVLLLSASMVLLSSSSVQQIRISTDAGSRLVAVETMGWYWYNAQPSYIMNGCFCLILLCLIVFMLWCIRHTLKTIAR